MQSFTEEFEVVTVNNRGGVFERQDHKSTTFIEVLDSDVRLEMVEIPGGMFRMGTVGPQGYRDEKPSHNVWVKPFLMSKYPVTQQQWKAVMKKELLYRCKGPNRPVDRVSWKDAIEFCKRLSSRTRKEYRLPGEAEWEYACRAGTSTSFHYGETIITELSNFVGEHTFQLEPKGVYRHGSTNVGLFPPNAFGLYDMHGNVWEWCQDDWHDDYSGAPNDGSTWINRKETTYKVMRGGSWHEPPQNCRSATRLRMEMSEAEDFFGFRIALSSLDEILDTNNDTFGERLRDFGKKIWRLNR